MYQMYQMYHFSIAFLSKRNSKRTPSGARMKFETLFRLFASLAGCSLVLLCLQNAKAKNKSKNKFNNINKLCLLKFWFLLLFIRFKIFHILNLNFYILFFVFVRFFFFLNRFLPENHVLQNEISNVLWC